MDRYSPLAPAFVRVLLLPVGHIERRRFLALLDGLRREAAIVRLEDVEPRVADGDLLLSPGRSPQGYLLFNYSTAVPSEHHHALSPYELFREPLLVIGVVDGLGNAAASGLQELGEAARYLREKHQRVVHRQLLVIGRDGDAAGNATSEHAVHVSEAALADATLLKEATLQVSARFLSELSTYTRALQASPSIQTPGQTARSLQRSASTREPERQPPSGRSTPTQNSEAGSPVDGSGVRTPPYGRSSPATSFDQIASNAQNALSRSESRANRRHGGRASSQDRMSASGFGSLSQEKLKNRGKARVGIVTGYLYMMAGQWAEALKILVDGTHKARTLSDFLWHAKGMEGVVVCLLLHAWDGVEFQIPTLCYPLGDRVTAGHSQRFSINMPSDFRTAEAAQKASLHKLSTYLPDLIKQILNLYDSGEASLELPFIVISEATIRCCKLLHVLQQNGELSQAALLQLVSTSAPGQPPASSSPASAVSKISNSTIANMLAEAQPVAEDNVPLPDQIAILAGVSSVYTQLKMKRKRAVAMREMIVKLTHALALARKRGAAEAGIHPAATLSADNGADALLAAIELSGGLHQMLEDVAVSYGVPSLNSGDDQVDGWLTEASGNGRLKQLVLNELSAFCEALPDLQGLLRMNTSLLKDLSTGAVTAEDAPTRKGLTREEQIRLTSTISRSVGVSKHLGLPKMEAKYWDPFLVRDIIFALPDQDYALINRAKARSAPAASADQRSSNPLLYDPNASRPETAADTKLPPATIVQGEAGDCIVKLQNPYEVAVEVESISLVSEGTDLSASLSPLTLGPLRIQEVPLSVHAMSSGECKITACRIKISGCEQQDFPIFRKPWSAPAPLLLKDAGQEAGILAIDRPKPPESEVVHVNVVEAQPLLALQSHVEDGLMLLDGQSVEVEVTLTNTGDTAASLIEFKKTHDILELREELTEFKISGRESKTVKMVLHGKAGVSYVQATFVYGRADEDSEYVRLLSLPIDVTVNASLQLQNLEILQAGESVSGDANALILSLDMGNAWPSSLDFECAICGRDDDGDGSVARGTLAPGHIQRIFLPLRRPELPHTASSDALRDALLNKLVGSWKGDGREGQIDFWKLRPPADALEMLRSEPVLLRLDVPNMSQPVKAGSFATIRARVVNNGAAALPLVVNFQPRGQHAVDPGVEERRFAVAGQQHRILPPLTAGQEASVEFGICPLLAGALEMHVLVRPAQMLREAAADEEGWVVQRSLPLAVV